MKEQQGTGSRAFVLYTMLLRALAPRAIVATSVVAQYSYAKNSASSTTLEIPRGKESLQYTTLLRKRAIFLTGSITDETAKNIVAQLLYLEMDDPGKPITMFIQSGGGLVNPGFAIYDMMQFVTSPIHTVGIGNAMSMAAILLAAGEPGHRVLLPHSRVMVHQSSLGIGRATAQDVMIRAVEAQETKKRLISVLSKHSKQPLDTINIAIERDNFMSPKDAVDFGLADRIATNITDIEIPSIPKDSRDSNDSAVSRKKEKNRIGQQQQQEQDEAPAKGGTREGYVR